MDAWDLRNAFGSKKSLHDKNSEVIFFFLFKNSIYLILAVQLYCFLQHSWFLQNCLVLCFFLYLSLPFSTWPFLYCSLFSVSSKASSPRFSFPLIRVTCILSIRRRTPDHSFILFVQFISPYLIIFYSLTLSISSSSPPPPPLMPFKFSSFNIAICYLISSITFATRN